MADMKSPSSMRLEGNVAENWAKFKQRFTFYLEATEKTILDASSAFLQIPLAEESSKLCTIATPFGRYCFCRLPYGLASSPEVYQKAIDNIFSGLEGILVYIDDILVYGKTEEEHDIRLKSVLDMARKQGLNLSKEKSQIKVNSVKYLGYNLTSEGLSVNVDKIKAISEYKSPENKAELQRFLGMVTYLGKFISNLSDKTGILRQLLSKDNEFIWSDNEQRAFNHLKECIVNAPVLSYYDPSKRSTVSVDASQYGLGAVLLQGENAVAYASVSLTDTQQRYSQIEKELLAILNGCRKFHYYIYGTRFTVETDHKPLLGLLKKPIEKLSPRLQRMALELFKYSFDIVHVPGKRLYVADALSRAPGSDVLNTPFLEAGAATVHAVLTSSKEKTEQLQQATEEDPELSMVKTYLKEGWPSSIQHLTPEVRPYWNIKSEIHHYEGLLFLGRRTIIPKAMREEVLMKLHVAHQGITSCQRKATNTIYWPNLMEDIKKMVECCQTCQAYQRSNTRQPLIPHEVPTLPWENIGIDFLYVNGDEFLQVIDYHSKFIEVKKVSSKTAEYIVSALKQIFRTHGIPKQLHSDNGPLFNSQVFHKFVQDYEMKHVTSSPCFPQSNGMVERSIETLKGILFKVHQSQGDPNLALIEYNNTPKQNLPSPAEMLMEEFYGLLLQ
ncbi:hypothetical protein JTE90_014775 [Oedothorax gibbosus]|uniref:RNA-directed DNA polymerase n=2 Tax=Oedothorax gibbosus TaxID=931172 RepID=A0AAV6U946_9ARAC|nr:hypothetical protein JTE90_014775 [Oedothorax gibbosus]